MELSSSTRMLEVVPESDSRFDARDWSAAPGLADHNRVSPFQNRETPCNVVNRPETTPPRRAFPCPLFQPLDSQFFPPQADLRH